MPHPDAKIEKIEIVKKTEEQSHIARGTDIQDLHTRRVQKSETLNRRHVKQPMAAPLARKNRPNYQSSATSPLGPGGMGAALLGFIFVIVLAAHLFSSPGRSEIGRAHV